MNTKFDTNKKYKFSAKKYLAHCSKVGYAQINPLEKCDGATVHVSKDGSEALIYGNIIDAGQVVNFMGKTMRMGGGKEEVCFLVLPEFCEEVN